MKPTKGRLLGAVVLALAGATFQCAAETIRVGGTGSAMPLLQKLGDLYRKNHPEVQIVLTMPPLGSSGGMRALAAGRLDLAVSASPPKPEDGHRFAQPIAWLTTPFILAGRDVPPGMSVSRRQLADIYAGKVTQWPGGQPIRLVLRPASDSDSISLRRLSPEMDAAIAQALQRNVLPMAENDLDNLQLVARTPGSLGAVSLGLLLVSESPIRSIALDGVLPSAKAVLDGSYPMAKTLTLLTAKNPGSSVASFVDFLRSPATARLVLRWGYMPAVP